MKKFFNILLLVAIVVAGVGIIGFTVPLYILSAEFAADPVLTHMQYPILLLSYLMLAFILVPLVIAFILVARSTTRNIFERKTVKSLTVMGHSFLGSFLAILAATLYSYAQLGAEVGLVGSYLLGLCFACFSASLIMYFIASLFAKAVEYKEENEWTV